MDEPGGGKNEWSKPYVVLGLIGYVAAAIGAWMSLDGRIVRVEQLATMNTRNYDKIDSKLDLLIDRELNGNRSWDNNGHSQ